MDLELKKRRSLEEYYLETYDSKYYEFGSLEFEVDPDETVEQMEKYTLAQQKMETAKCALSFPYFALKYIKILHPTRGLVPFLLYKYQKRVVRQFESNRFNIISKFRQGGLTTLAELWGMWRCLFKLDEQIMLVSKTDREAKSAGEIINRAVDNLPFWMKPSLEGKWNDHQKQFHDTGANLFFYTAEAGRGRSLTYLIVDEAAFIKEMDRYWGDIYPTLSAGGSCIVISTVNGLGNWYQEYYYDAKEEKNRFNVIDLDFWEHPDYNDEVWIADTKAQLGEKKWLQEVMRSFLGSGETYIPAEIIAELQASTRNSLPKRKLFNKWANKLSSEKDLRWDTDGALWIWQEPIDGHDYVIGVDAAEGVGNDGDSSCLQIFDSNTLEQVAEFYSNLVPPYIFAQIANEIAIYYNHALVVVENLAAGSSVLSNLQHTLFYDNLFFEPPKGKTSRVNVPGIKVTLSNRPVLLEGIQHGLMNKVLKINSMRLVKELTTFIYNAQAQKAQAQKGKHDDAVMAVCFAIHARRTMLRGIPMGAEVPEEITATFKSLTYEEIKNEILAGMKQDLIDERSIDPLVSNDEDMMAGVVLTTRRRNDKLLREFGW